MSSRRTLQWNNLVLHQQISSSDKAKDLNLKMCRSQEETGIIETIEKTVEIVVTAWSAVIAVTVGAKRETTKINQQENSISTQIRTIGFTT